MRQNPIIHTLMALCTILLFSACEHKDLCRHHPHDAKVRVVFDWSKAPNANPEWMNVVFYPLEGGDPFNVPFTDIKGGEITMLIGSYRAICYNGDTESVSIYEEKDYDKAYLSTRRTRILTKTFGKAYTGDAPKAPGTEDQEILLEPDMVWGDRISYFDIIETEEEQVITFYPKEEVMDVTVTILNAENLSYCQGQSGALSGLSSGVLMGSDKVIDDQNIIPMDLFKLDDTTLEGKILTFGHCPSREGRHFYSLYVILGDGTKYVYTWDVTDQMHATTQDPRHIHIILDGVPIPKPITNGSGFDPEVDDWHTEYIDVVM